MSEQVGLLVIDKPAGWTSHQVVGRVRRIVGLRKVGHAGTLDPMATGVLLVAVGRATRLLGHLASQDKTYLATIRLGASTTTDDAEGETLDSPGVAGLTEEALRTALGAFRGRIHQVPSSVSAVKIDGRRAYDRVRAGEDVQLAAREVVVDRFDITDIRPGADHWDVDVVVDCSSGTYIRALARDLGRDLGAGGHLTALRRTRIGQWGIDQAQSLDEHTTDVDLIALDDAVGRCLPTLTITSEQAADVRHGRRLTDLDLPAPITALLDPHGRFLALYQPDGSDAVARAVFAPATGEEP